MNYTLCSWKPQASLFLLAINVHLNHCAESAESTLFTLHTICLKISPGEIGARLKTVDSKWVPHLTNGCGRLRSQEESDVLIGGYHNCCPKTSGN